MGRVQGDPGQHPGQGRRPHRRDRELTRRRPALGAAHALGEGGTGVFATLAGVFVFLLFLLLAVQVTYNLYATSSVTAAAYDGARLAAGSDAAGRPQSNGAAEAHVRYLLGAYGRQRALGFDWHGDSDPGYKVLTVTARNPSFLPAALRAPLGFDTVERTVRVRIERETGRGP